MIGCSLVADLLPGHHRLACPECGKRPTDRTLSIDVDHEHAVYHCFRCGASGALRHDRLTVSHSPTRSATKAPQRHEVLSDYGRELWRSTRALSGPALAYLGHRCCRLPPLGSHLRWIPDLKHPSGHVGPALVALVTDAVTCEPLTLHRTWITSTGKANVDPPRLLLAGHRKLGGVIRLWPDDEVTLGLGIAEGIETALSLAWAHSPAWACIDAGNLKSFPILGGIESLVIAADHDPAGLAAAEACALRWHRAGRDCVVWVPKSLKADINELVTDAA
jgi:putative DNA primase/helicase